MRAVVEVEGDAGGEAGGGEGDEDELDIRNVPLAARVVDERHQQREEPEAAVLQRGDDAEGEALRLGRHRVRHARPQRGRKKGEGDALQNQRQLGWKRGHEAEEDVGDHEHQRAQRREERAAAESVRAASVLRVERGSRKFDVDATTTPQAPAVARAPAATATDVDGVIVLRVASFTDGVRDESARTIRAVAADRKSAPYVIDVRSNPGGFADEAAATFGLFAPAATPFATAVGPNGAVAAKYVTSGPPTELAVPAPTALAVLVDEDTRSAAELFAAAVRAQGGTVVGQTTFGKRSAQSLVPLRAAPNYAVRLTTARTVDATGADVDGVGVAPDLAAGTPSSALDELLLRRGFFFDFATYFDRLHPGLDDAKVETVLSREGTKLWRSFVKSWNGGVDDDEALPDYPSSVQTAAARAAQKQLTRELVADATSRRTLPPRAVEAVLARRGAIPSRATTAGDDEALRLALDVVRPRDGLSAARLARLDASRAAASDRPPARTSQTVVGFDPDAECLPLQTCDARRYVYVVEP